MLIKLFGLTSEDTGIIFSSFCFIQVFWTFLIHLLSGADIVLTPFSIERTLHEIQQRRVTILITTASVLRGLLRSTDFSTRSGSLRAIITGEIIWIWQH
jgi:non-ribosomal peptide synthetase component F